MKTLKSIALTLICILSMQISMAQKRSYPEVGAIWYYGWRTWRGSVGYYTIEVTKDTIILDKTCFEFRTREYWEPESFSEISKRYVLYEDNKIYQYHDGQFYLLYDFNVEKGDTIYTSIVYNEFSWPSPEPILDIALEVKDVGEIEIDGEKLKIYTADLTEEYKEKYQYPFFRFHYYTATENIGGSNYFFPYFSYGADDATNYPNGLRCYINGDFQKKSSTMDCEYYEAPRPYPPIIIGVDEYADNPISFALNNQNIIVSGIESPADYTLTHANGNTVKSGKLGAETIDISGLPAGMYILTIYTAEQPVSYRFVKQ